jgi:serine/tyrosine/threonine adenylyltransferase
METSKADFTSTFRDLTYDDLSKNDSYHSLAFKKWHSLWQARLLRNAKPIELALDLMRKYNPVVVPYNHFVEEALSAAVTGDIHSFTNLLSALENPFSLTSLNEDYRELPINPKSNYQTFCGT